MIAQFESQAPDGNAVAQLEILVRTAVFKTANELVGWMLQQAVERIDAAYQPKPGEACKGREILNAQGIFGHFPLSRDYYYHPGKKQGRSPADDALGLEVSYTPALAKLLCVEGADESTYLKAERHLEQTGGIRVSARQIQRVVQRVGTAAQQWQERPAKPSECQRCDAPVMYLSADGTGVPMVPEELAGRKGKQADGKAKTRQVYLGCVFTQHEVDEKGRPVRDWESTTYVSSFSSAHQRDPQGVRGHTPRDGGRASPALFRNQCQPDAVWHLSEGEVFHRFRRCGSGLQDRHWRALQTIGDVLVRIGCREYPGAALHL